MFFNPIFTTTVDKEIHEYTIKPFQGNKKLLEIKTYCDLLAAEHCIHCPMLKTAVRRKIHSVDNTRDSADKNNLYATKGGKMYTFKPSNNAASQSSIYSEIIQF